MFLSIVRLTFLNLILMLFITFITYSVVEYSDREKNCLS